MSGILVMAESRRGELRDISLELVEAGRLLKPHAGPLVAALAASGAGELAGALNVEGVDEIVTVETPREHFEAHAAEQALEALIADVDPAVVLLGHTIDALGYGPAVAARNGLGFASDAIGIEWEGAPVVRRGAYGGGAHRVAGGVITKPTAIGQMCRTVRSTSNSRQSKTGTGV